MIAEYTVKLPDVGEGIAQAEIVEWHVAIGDTISEDDVLVEVMTDKATVELPSPVGGVITWFAANAGDMLAVGADLVKIDVTDTDTDVTDTDTYNTDVTDTDTYNTDVYDTDRRAAATPDTATPDLAVGDAPGGEPATSAPMHLDVPATTEAKVAVDSPVAAPAAAPAVRQRAHELGIDLASITGTGPDGRVVHRDLDTRLTKAHVPPAAGATNRTSKNPTSTATDIATVTDLRPTLRGAHDVVATNDVVERIKIIGLRRNIAERMQLSKARIPHFTYVEEIDVTELEHFRGQRNDQPNHAALKLTVLPLLMRALVLAIGEYPQMNARFDDDAGVVERHTAVHLGIAVQTPRGLMVPVVKNAQARDIWDCAAEVARLSEAARTSKVKIQDLVGSTITITSLGALGGIVSTPVINYPEVAIVGVNKIVERPTYCDGVIVPRKIMNLSSSFDHRIIDGVDAAGFVQAIRRLLETPALLFAS